jgi:hypothetical protein
MQWDDLLKNMVKQAGVVGMKKAEGALDKLQKEMDEPWKRAVMDMLGDAVEEYGWEGVERVQKAIDDLAKGKSPDLSFASLKARSDALALLQNMEADEKTKAKDFFAVVGEVLGVVLKAVIKGLLKG